MKKVNALNHFAVFIFVFTILNTFSAFAGPSRTTYQAKIVKPDGYPLETSSVNFKFTILDPSATCILYSESYSSVNMSSTGGLISFSLGSGIKSFPVSSTTFEQIFSNITPNMGCDTGGGPPAVYTPLANDSRKIVMQFNDGNGWQTLPAMTINAVPYAMYANDTLKFNGLGVSDFVQLSSVPTCAASEALRYNGSMFSCIAAGGTGTVTSSTVITALGYTPADGASVTTVSNYASSVSSTVFSVSSTVSSLANTVSDLQSSVGVSFAAITSSQWNTSGTTINYTAGNVGVGTTTPVTKLDVSGGLRIGTENATCAASYAGTLRYNAGNVEYCNGSIWSAFGVSGAGLQTFNGSTSGTQSFANGTGGIAPNFVTANGVHTLNIPYASAGSTTAGLISNTDYQNFSNKITSSAASIAQVLGYTPANSATVSTLQSSLGPLAYLSSLDLGSVNASGTLAVARLPSFVGDVMSTAASNTLVLSNTGVTAGTYTKVTVDAKGRVTSGTLLSNSDVTTALGYTPANSATIVSSQWVTSGSAIYYNAGNVGIGTASPVGKLDVQGTAYIGATTTNAVRVEAGVIRMQDNADAGRSLEYQGTKLNIGQNNSATQSGNATALLNAGSVGDGVEIVRFRTNTDIGYVTMSQATVNTFNMNFVQSGTSQLYLKSDGNVGIGITNPNASSFASPGKILAIASTGGADTRSILELSGPTAGTTGTNKTGELVFTQATGGRYNSSIFGFRDAADNSQGIGFSTYSAATLSEKVRITAAGNVGIGTTAPSAKLHLAAGTSSLASLKLTSGTLLASPQSGTVEYDGTNLYFTDGTNTRRTLAATTGAGTYDNASLISNSSGNIVMYPNGGTGSVTVSATTASTNSSTGALVVKGGLGVAGTANIGGGLNVSGSSVLDGSLKLSSMTSGSVLFAGTNGVVSQDNSNFYWDNANKRLGLGTNTPQGLLQVGSGYVQAAVPFAVLAGTPGTPATTGTTQTNGILRLGTNTSNSSVFDMGLYNAAPFGAWLQAQNGGDFSDHTLYPIVLQPNGGNVGIGTTNPGQLLEVRRDQAGTATIAKVINSNSTTGTQARFDLATATPNAYSIMSVTENGGGVASFELSTGDGISNGMYFTAGSASTSQPFIFRQSTLERMRIAANGNVGIGTASPPARLTIRDQHQSGYYGNIQLSSMSGSSSSMGATGIVVAPQEASDNFPNDTFSYLTLSSRKANLSGSVHSGVGIIAVEPGSANTTYGSGDMKFYLRNDDAPYHVPNAPAVPSAYWMTPKVVFKSNGNVGIGTATPQTKLEVAGDIQSNETYFTTKIFADGWAIGDYAEVVQAAPAGAAGSSALLEVSIAGTRGNWVESSTYHLVSAHAESDVWRELTPVSINYYTTFSYRCFTVDANGVGGVVKFRIRAIRNSTDCSAASSGQFPIVFKAHSSGHNGGWTALTATGTGATVTGFRTTVGSEWNLYTGASRNAAIHTITAKEGYVGIGVSSPLQMLHVTNGSASSGDQTIAQIGSGAGSLFFTHNQPGISGNSKYKTGWKYEDTGYASLIHFYTTGKISFQTAPSGTAGAAATFTERMVILNDSGNVGIGVVTPTYQLQLSTDSAAKPGTSTWTIASDMRLKNSRAPFTRGINELLGLNTIYFTYKKDNPLGLPSDKEYVGIRAQDAQKVIPEAVTVDEKGFLHVTNDAIIWTVVNAVKELYYKWFTDSLAVHRELASVKAENAELKKENAEIKMRLEKIEKALTEPDKKH